MRLYRVGLLGAEKARVCETTRAREEEIDWLLARDEAAQVVVHIIRLEPAQYEALPSAGEDRP